MIEHFCEIARRAARTGREPFSPRQIRWFIDLDADGHVVGFTPTSSRDEEGTETRGKQFDCPVRYMMQVRKKETKNRKGKITKTETSIAGVNDNDSTWRENFLFGPANEMFKNSVRGRDVKPAKFEATRSLVELAHAALASNKTLHAVGAFFKSDFSFDRLPSIELTDEFLSRFEAKKTTGGEQRSREIISFRVSGRIAIHDRELNDWWRQNQKTQRDDVRQLLPEGSDIWSFESDKLAVRFPYVFGNLKFASFNSAPFVSYGLGDQTAMLRLETAEMAAAGLNHLRDSSSTHVRLGETVTVFWTSTPKAPTDFIQLLSEPDPLRVRDFLLNTFGGIETQLDTSRFYAVSFYTPKQGRFSVLSVQDQTLPAAKSSLRDFFQAVGMGEEHAEPIALKNLADATIPTGSKRQKLEPALETFTSLLNAALFAKGLPERMLPQISERQRMELAKGFDSKTEHDFESRLRARAALLTLYFDRNLDKAIRQENIMNPNDPVANDPAVLCGRMLAILDLIHDKAHDGRSSSSPANRFYGSASTTPALVFPRLCKLARYHLDKYKNKGLARKHEFGVPAGKRADGVSEDAPGLAQIADRILAVCGRYPRMLSLEEQGRFALGFYHERARKWPNYVKLKDDGTIVEAETEDDLVDETKPAASTD